MIATNVMTSLMPEYEPIVEAAAFALLVGCDSCHDIRLSQRGIGVFLLARNLKSLIHDTSVVLSHPNW